MDSSCFQFYKHMGGFFMHSISLPEKLTRKLEHLVGKLLELKGPTSTSWYVGLVKSGNKLVLQPGWNDFASANNISQNDNLVFKLVGGSKFEVFVFDPTGCEKSGTIEKEEEEEEQEPDEGLGSIVGEELSNDVYIDTKEQDIQYEVKGETGSSLSNKKKSTDEEQGIRGEMESSLLNKKKSTDEEQGEIRGETESSLYNKKQSADEEQGNKGETESSLYNKKKSTDGEQGGSEASNDSIPLAELRKIILYQKAAVRKSKVGTKMQQPNIATKLPSKKLEQNREEEEEISNDLIPIGKVLRINSQKNKHHSEIHGEIESPLKRPRRKPSNNITSKKKKKGKSIKSCYNNYTPRVPRNAEDQRRAQQLARKVQNRNPYFHKSLTKFNLTHPYCLPIPTKFGADHLKRENLEVILCCPDDEQTWYATSYFRSAKNFHTLLGPTWEKFVKEKNLKIDDICLFELDKTAKRLTFVVHTSRTSNKLDS